MDRLNLLHHLAVLRAFESRFATGDARFDREEIVSHATLSAWTSHWPSRSNASIDELLTSTIVIREVEKSRWIKQRRLAISVLARALNRIDADRTSEHDRVEIVST